MDLSFFEFVGDGLGNDDIVSSTSSILENKYNRKFIVNRIGNRYGMDEDDTVTLYFSPIENKDFVFTGKYNLDSKILIDDFYYRRVCYELERNISTLLEKNGIRGIVRATLIKKNSLDEDISLKDFVFKYKNTTVLTYIIVDVNNSDKIINDIALELSNIYPEIRINSYIFTSTEEEYEKLNKEISDLSYFSKSMIEGYVEKDPSIYKVLDGNIIKVK